MRNNLFRAALALGIAGTVAFGAGTAFAVPDKCQKGIEGAFTKFQGAVSGALTKCADGIRAEQVKGVKGSVAKAGLSCEKSLAGVYGATKAVDKFNAAVDKLFPLTCTDTDLTIMGHLLSGSNGPAPGTSTTKFTKDYLLITAERDAINMKLSQVPDAMNLILQAQTAIGCPSPALPAPNLCGFKIACKTASCKLVTGAGHSGARLLTAQLDQALPMSGTEPFDMCRVTGPLAPALETGILYIAGTPSRTLAPIPVAGMGLTVCVDSLRGAGYCDCTGKALKLNTSFCQDRLATDAGGGLDACGAPLSAASPDPTFSGTKAGLPLNTASGSSIAGDCFDQSTVQFSIVSTAPGTLDLGPDGIPCTADDTGTPSTPVPVPLTTGTAAAIVMNAVKTSGSCPSPNDSTGCVEDKDCTNPCSTATKHCVNTPGTACKTAIDCPVQSCSIDPVTDIENLNLSDGPGHGIPGPATDRCANYEIGTLSGLTMVGVFPAGGGGSALGDSITSFKIECGE